MTISPRNLVQFQNREAVFWRFKPDSNRRFRPRTERFGPFILGPVFGQGRKGSALLRFGGVLAIFEPRWPPAATGIRRKPRIFYRWSSLIPMPVTVIWTPNSSRRPWFKWKTWISGSQFSVRTAKVVGTRNFRNGSQVSDLQFLGKF